MTSIEHITPLSEILDMMKSRDAKDHELVSHAYAFAERAHEGQTRYSGAPYFVHVSAVGLTLSELGMAPAVVAAGLLHDTIEDCGIPPEEIETTFGKETRFLVEGVTKLGKLKYQGVERHVESMRKLFIATAKDMRVIIIKLADRLHNVSTLRFVPEHKRQRIALETLEVYAPIANRLSIGTLKGLLEDFSFPYAHPEEYAKVRDIIEDQRKLHEERITKLYRSFQRDLAEHGIISASGSFRVKRTYSLYKKLVAHDWDPGKIYDILAIRVIVPTIGDCYQALGVAHALWRPLPGRIKDYIAFPKPNGYQSLHTTVFTGDGTTMEVQLRTPEMDHEAALGAAAHFAYKERDPSKKAPPTPKRFAWVMEFAKLQEVARSEDYMEALKTDFFTDRVFVFTPKGDAIDLPVDSTPLDFAYAVHSDIGDHVSGAKVNGKLVALDTPLKNGDIVDIDTKSSAKPSKKWLDYAKTSLARKHIQTALREAREK
jgi:guanosine-3',5'-bis(diphosphate) 3'-pyrophosphohydrolase